MSVRMRHTKGHTGNRRSHHALKEPRLATCRECGASRVRHHACPECGMYRGKRAFNAAAIVERKRARKEAKERAIGEVTGTERTPEAEGDEVKPENSTDSTQAEHAKPLDDARGKPLSAEELSKK